MTHTITAHNLEFFSIGAVPELKKVSEVYWHGNITQQLQDLRRKQWQLQADAN